MRTNIERLLNTLPLTPQGHAFMDFARQNNNPILAESLNKVFFQTIHDQANQKTVDSTSLSFEMTRAVLGACNTMTPDQRMPILKSLYPLAHEACAHAEAVYTHCAEYIATKKIAPELMEKARTAACVSASSRIALNNLCFADSIETLELAQVTRLFEAQQSHAKALYTGESAESDIAILKEKILADLHQDSTLTENLRTAQHQLSDIERNEGATPLDRATAQATVQFYQNQFDYVQYERNKNNARQCINLISITQSIAERCNAPAEIIQLLSGASKITRGVEAGYTIYWNICNYAAAAAIAGPFAPVVAVAGAVNLLLSLFQDQDADPRSNDREIIMNSITAVWNEVMASKQAIQAMRTALTDLIVHKDRLDADRHTAVIQYLSKIHKNIITEFFKLSDEMLDAKNMIATLTERVDAARAETRMLFSEWRESDYVFERDKALNYYRLQTVDEGSIHHSWLYFHTFLVTTVSSQTFTGSQEATTLNPGKIESQIQTISAIARSQSVNCPARLPHPTLWIDGILSVMTYAYRLSALKWDDKHCQEYNEMKQNGERLRGFIVAVKTNPAFLNGLVQNYLNSMTAVTASLRNFSGDRAALLLLLRPHTELGRRIIEKQGELVKKEILLAAAQENIARSEEVYRQRDREFEDAYNRLVATTHEKTTRVGAIIRSFDPPGIGEQVFDFAIACATHQHVIQCLSVNRSHAAAMTREINGHWTTVDTRHEELRHPSYLRACAETNCHRARDNHASITVEVAAINAHIISLINLFTESYPPERVSDHDIFLAYLSHLSQADKQQYNVMRLANSNGVSVEGRPLRDALERMTQPYILLSAILQIAFHDHAEIQQAFGQLWSASHFIEHLRPNATCTVYESIQTHFMPALKIFHGLLLKESMQAKLLSDKHQSVPLTHALLETVFEQMKIFETVMALRNNIVKPTAANNASYKARFFAAATAAATAATFGQRNKSSAPPPASSRRAEY